MGPYFLDIQYYHKVNIYTMNNRWCMLIYSNTLGGYRVIRSKYNFALLKISAAQRGIDIHLSSMQTMHQHRLKNPTDLDGGRANFLSDIFQNHLSILSMI